MSRARPLAAALALRFALALGLCLAVTGTAQQGLPLLRGVSPDHADASSQSFDLAIDSNGAVYVANGGGVLFHEGARWRLVPIGSESYALTVKVGPDGRVWVGGTNEVGLLEASPDGQLRYRSLIDKLPPERRRFGQVVSLAASPSGLFLMTDEFLAFWGGESFEVVEEFDGNRPWPRTFQPDEEIYLARREGLFRLQGRRLEPLPGGEAFAGRRIDQVLEADDGLLVSVRGEGLFRLRAGQVVPFAPEASRWARASRVFTGTRLRDGRWVLGSLFGGALLLRPDGSVDQILDARVGLPDDFVSGVGEDHEGGLWIALNTGLVRAEVASPMTVIDRRLGLPGSVYAVARHRGVLWAGTAGGLFRESRTAAPDLAGRPSSFEQVPEPAAAIWSLLSLGDELLVGTSGGLSVVGPDGRVSAVSGMPDGTGYALAACYDEPGCVWVGLSEGLVRARRQAAGWAVEGRVAGAPRDIRSFVARSNRLWLGSDEVGVVGLEAPWQPGDAARWIRVETSRSAGLLGVVEDRVLVARKDRLERLDEAQGRLVPDSALAGLRTDRPFASWTIDRQGRVWLGSSPVQVLKQSPGSAEWRSRPLVELPMRGVQTLLAEPDGVVWLAADNGLYRVAEDRLVAGAALAAPLLTSVVPSRGPALYAGLLGAPPPAFDLPPGLGRLRLDFAPRSFRQGLRYQSRLEPIDDTWSEPVAEPFQELTRLPPGPYTLRVRTLAPGGEVGPEAAWSLTLPTPWYLTDAATAAWVGLLVLLVLAYGRFRSRVARRRAALLEQRVQEQTAALRSTVDTLQETQRSLEVANARLEELSMLDELTGLANRRRLLPTLDVEWSLARRQGRPLAFVLLDLDHFKSLNDTYGHGEGDRCLRAIGAFLAEAVPRVGDLAVRYGGEEFAVLLPGTDRAGALQVAERLRAGIEALALLNEGAPHGQVTASFGVAVRVPQLGEEPGELIEAADRALYQAKTAGRNRVQLAGPLLADADPRSIS